ncbi:MAG TPA: carbohydrate binding domain-containing protein, partial [Clostridia bacterium]|nr:carbohydrate binding domain-containing protein [Clostridia bacterium]
MKRYWKLSILVALVVVVATFGFSACNTSETEVGKELLLNGDFEGWETTSSESTAGKFNYWTKGTLGKVESYTAQRMSHISSDSTKPADAGSYALILSNTSASASYMSQSVKVDKNATYHIQYFVKMSSAFTIGSDDYAVGPHLSFLENTDYVIEEITATGKWIEVNAYVVPKNTDYLTVCLMIGTEGRMSIGTAYFDSVSMKKVENVPTGTEIVEIFRDKVARYNINVSGTLFVTLIALFSVAVLVAAYVLIRRTYRGKLAFLNFDEHIEKDEEKNSKSQVKRILTHPISIACYLG